MGNKKSNIIASAITATLVLAVGANAHAGREGNGGGGILENGQVYVTDLVESGAELNPYFDPNIQENASFSIRISKAMGNMPNLPVVLISRKLNEIYSYYDHALPLEILQMIEQFTWQTVDFSLMPIDDETPVLNIDPSLQVQLAARTMRSVKIDRNQWQQMNPQNRAALIMHEALYALSFSQSSDQTRVINGYLFTADFKNRGLTGYLNILADDQTFEGKDPLLDCAGSDGAADCGSAAGGYLYGPASIDFYDGMSIQDGHVGYDFNAMFAVSRSTNDIVVSACHGLRKTVKTPLGKDNLWLVIGYSSFGETLAFSDSGSFLVHNHTDSYLFENSHYSHIVLSPNLENCEGDSTRAVNNLKAHLQAKFL